MLNKISLQLEKIESLLDSDDKFNKKISHWSVYKQLEHILIVKKNITSLILKAKEPEEKKPRTFLSYIVLTLGYIPRGKAKAPSIVLPEGSSKQDLKKLLIEIEKNIKTLIQNKFNPDLVVLDHPYFGGLSSKQSLRFLEVHTKHHFKIVRDIVNS